MQIKWAQVKDTLSNLALDQVGAASATSMNNNWVCQKKVNEKVLLHSTQIKKAPKIKKKINLLNTQTNRLIGQHACSYIRTGAVQKPRFLSVYSVTNMETSGKRYSQVG